MPETHDRRSPYLVLGLEYGASVDEARRAFARCSRRVRRMDSPAYGVEDLTWALHEIESEEDPISSVRFFRVPANRATILEPRDGDLFRPGPARLSRRNAEPSDSDVERLALAAARELVERLLTNATAEPVDNPYAAA